MNDRKACVECGEVDYLRVTGLCETCWDRLIQYQCKVDRLILSNVSNKK